MLNALRQQRVGIGRQAAALFLLAWLAVALQPCALAFSAPAADAAMAHMPNCPHCPQGTDAPSAHDYCEDGLCGALSGVHAQEAAPALPASAPGEPPLLTAFVKLAQGPPARQFLRLHERTRIPDPPTLAFRVLLI